MPLGRPRFPDLLGMTKCERAIYARLKKGPAALSSLAHAGRCSSGSIKAILSRLRRKLPAGELIPRSMYGYQAYALEFKATDDLPPNSKRCKTETGIESAKPEKKSGAGRQGNTKRNNMLYASESLPDYTLCELTLRLLRHYSGLAWATILRASPLLVGLATSPSPLSPLSMGRVM